MKIALLISGGVDSSVALELLAREQSHEIHAYYLKIWLEEELSFLGDCPWEEDLDYARRMCDKLSIPLSVIPLQDEYRELVIEYVLSELKNGRTPSPDILCNEYIKFGSFIKKIGDTIDKVASGHYAKIEKIDSLYYLKRAPDPVKDQTYFLSSLSQEQLSKILFPIGDLYKKDVRKLANEYDIPAKNRKDSQGICFLGKIKYNDFVKFHLGEKNGKIIDKSNGKTIGKHQGCWFYTIGQRQGLGMGGGPWYVVGKDMDENVVYVDHKDSLGDSSRNFLKVTDLSWNSSFLTSGNDFLFKLRHGPKLINGIVDDISSEVISITLSEADNGIALGQSAVFYKEDICYGRGVICG